MLVFKSVVLYIYKIIHTPHSFVISVFSSTMFFGFSNKKDGELFVFIV